MPRLSYSAIRLYSECGQKYKYNYVQRIRETTKSGALLFGTAFDKAVEAVLVNRDIDEKAVFDRAFEKQDINGRVVSLPESLVVVYANSDYDDDILTEEDRRFLLVKASQYIPRDLEEHGNNVGALVDQCKTYKKQKAFRSFKESENKFLNLANWLSLRRKGHLMLDANREIVLPKITKVVTTQAAINLNNGTGDSLIGFADVVCHWDGDTEPTVFDYKTSSIEYEEDSVLKSMQLTIYAHALQVRKAGYFVFRKGIKKNRTKSCSICGYEGSGSRAKTCTDESKGSRCGGEWNESIRPSVDVQIIRDIIPERTEDIVIQNIDEVNKGINAGVFVRNFDSCRKPWGDCPYMKLCYENSMEDLEELPPTSR